MEEQLVQLLLSAALGGVCTFAWSQVAFGNRLTRLETKVEGFEAALEEVKDSLKSVAGRRTWPHHNSGES